jgi:hypothetical protein
MKSVVSFRRVLWLALVLLYGTPLFAQREMMTFGVKGGAQLTSSFQYKDLRSLETEAKYVRPIVGLTFEKPLSQTISIGADALYNPEKYRFQQSCLPTKQGCVGAVVDWETHGHTLEFPVVVKKYWGTNVRDRFFANTGMSFRSMTMSSWALPTVCAPPPTTPTAFCDFILDDTHGTLGFVFGGGVDFQRGHFHFYPELRYTRWLGNRWTERSELLNPNQNALNILLGFTFGR